jgi:hypothetical protein
MSGTGFKEKSASESDSARIVGDTSDSSPTQISGYYWHGPVRRLFAKNLIFGRTVAAASIVIAIPVTTSRVVSNLAVMSRSFLARAIVIGER